MLNNSLMPKDKMRELRHLLEAYRNENVFCDTQIVDCATVVLESIEERLNHE